MQYACVRVYDLYVCEEDYNIQTLSSSSTSIDVFQALPIQGYTENLRLGWTCFAGKMNRDQINNVTKQQSGTEQWTRGSHKSSAI